MTSEQANRKRQQIADAKHLICTAESYLHANCPHENLHYKNYGSTGNYDPSCDAYWIAWNCHDCGKRWQTEQSKEERYKYPNAINDTRT